MTGQELLKNYPLELLITKKSIELFNMYKIVKDSIKELSRDYVLTVKEEIQDDDVLITITCPNANYAMTFFQLGKSVAKKLSQI